MNDFVCSKQTILIIKVLDRSNRSLVIQLLLPYLLK